MAVLKNIGVMSLAKILGAIYGVIGFIAGFFLFLIMGVAGGVAGFGQGGGMMIGAGLLMWVFYAVAFAIVGFVGGAIQAILYNVFAEKVGGVEVEISK